MNVGEYGQVFRFNRYEDISATTPTLILEPRIGTAIERTTADGVTIPTSTKVIDGETFTANQYIEYVIKEGDLTFAGRWRAKLKMKYSPTKELITDYQRFTVLP